jgi:hypothetical protein
MLTRRISKRTLMTMLLERLTWDNNVEETEELNSDKTRRRAQRRKKGRGRGLWITKIKVK